MPNINIDPFNKTFHNCKLGTVICWGIQAYFRIYADELPDQFEYLFAVNPEILDKPGYISVAQIPGHVFRYSKGSAEFEFSEKCLEESYIGRASLLLSDAPIFCDTILNGLKDCLQRREANIEE